MSVQHISIRRHERTPQTIAITVADAPPAAIATHKELGHQALLEALHNPRYSLHNTFTLEGNVVTSFTGYVPFFCLRVRLCCPKKMTSVTAHFKRVFRRILLCYDLVSFSARELCSSALDARLWKPVEVAWSGSASV